MIKVSPTAIAKVRKKYSLKKNDSLTSAQFLEAQNLSSSVRGTRKKINASKNKMSPTRTNKNHFFFSYFVSIAEDGSVTITIEGNHISKNAYDSLPEYGKKSKHAYKQAIKNGAKDCYLKQRALFREAKKNKIFPLQESFISYTFHSRFSRDWDNNLENVKRFQDTLVTELNIIADDKRGNLIPMKNPIREKLVATDNERKCVIRINPKARKQSL